MCDKIKYESYRLAIGAARGINKREGHHFRVYKCECGSFHLTSLKTKKLLPVKDKKYPPVYELKKEKKMPAAKINLYYKPEPVIIHTGKAFK